VFSFLIENENIEKQKIYIPFLRFFPLVSKTEKWKIDKNIVFSHKQDFSNF